LSDVQFELGAKMLAVYTSCTNDHAAVSTISLHGKLVTNSGVCL